MGVQGDWAIKINPIKPNDEMKGALWIFQVGLAEYGVSGEITVCENEEINPRMGSRGGSKRAQCGNKGIVAMVLALVLVSS